FRAWGTDLADLFETAARAMFSLEYDVDTVPQDESPSVSVQGDDLEGALYAWLSELIWLHDAEGFFLSDVWVDPIGADLSVRAVDQVAHVAHLPGIVGASMAMPDIHWGYGFPIGGVAATDVESDGVVSPGGVGFDIGCGVRLLRSSLSWEDVSASFPALVDAL